MEIKIGKYNLGNPLKLLTFLWFGLRCVLYCLYCLFWLWLPVMGIPWLVVGLSNQDLCHNGGAFYLVVMGGLTLLSLIIQHCLIICCTEIREGKILSRILFGSVFLAILITTIWGSVNVFGEFYNFLGRAERSEVSFKFLSSKS